METASPLVAFKARGLPFSELVPWVQVEFNRHIVTTLTVLDFTAGRVSGYAAR